MITWRAVGLSQRHVTDVSRQSSGISLQKQNPHNVRLILTWIGRLDVVELGRHALEELDHIAVLQVVRLERGAPLFQLRRPVHRNVLQLVLNHRRCRLRLLVVY